MQSRKIKLVINTPTDKQSFRDGYRIRRECIDLCIPYITTMPAAKAAASAILRMRNGAVKYEVKSINRYLGYVGDSCT
jgi:carbamoyl-phosphate synthase large subunit